MLVGDKTDEMFMVMDSWWMYSESVLDFLIAL